MRARLAVAFTLASCCLVAGAFPQEPPARERFGHVARPASAATPAAIGGYSKGCLLGAERLAATGDSWQAMRLSRNRYWGHPRLIRFIEDFAEAAQAGGWPGLLVGDLAQPRGGPMLTGHRSHQIGLDADLWFLPAPDEPLETDERETLSAVSMLGSDGKTVDPARFRREHVKLLETAARFPEVARIFVNPAIKRALCETVDGNRNWLAKIRPWWGHHYHFHVRLNCPDGDDSCVDQPPPPAGDGCDSSLAWWFSDDAARRLAAASAAPSRELELADLPEQCRSLVTDQPDTHPEG
ncbi:MAG: penicillin-insensitive murein endopeptidase [Geminicoccaceae bacterium]